MKKYLLITLLALLSYGGMGQVTFQKRMNNITGGSSELNSIKQTNDEGYIMTGVIRDVMGIADISLIKTNVYGDTLWVKSYGGSSEDRASSIIQTNDKGYFITGITTSFGAGNYDVYLIKTDSLGVLEWSKTIGGTDIDWANYGEQSSDGGYIIAGVTKSYGAGDYDGYLIKTDSIGNTLWTKTYGSGGNDRANCVQQTTDGGFIITGILTDTTAGNIGLYLLKTNTLGDTLWSKQFLVDNVIYSICVGYSIKQTADGGYIISGNGIPVGTTGGNAILIKTDSAGTIEWSEYTDGVKAYDAGYSVQQTTDGGYVMGMVLSFLNSTGPILIIKTDASGIPLWEWSCKNLCESNARVEQTKDDGFVIVSPDVHAGYPNFIKTDVNGNSGCDTTISISLDSLHLHVHHSSYSISSSGISTNPLTIVKRPGAKDTTYCSNFSIGIPEINKQKSTIEIYPNPFSSQTTITFSEEQRNTSLIITDVLGNTILQSEITTPKSEINLSGVAKGIYFAKIKTEKGIVNKKIIVQ